MKKIVSLIKACMTQDMALIKINGKNRAEASKKILPIVLVFIIFFSIGSYAKMIIEPLAVLKFEHMMLVLFAVVTTVMTLFEGIYKSSNLLFNCKDDNMLLSLPLKKSTVLFIRVLKFYVFEVAYNALFLIPAIVVYAMTVNVGISYYIVSILALLLLPVVPIVISCFIGAIISASSSKFKYKNIAQIIITTIFLLLVLYASFNVEGIIGNLANNANNISDAISKVYYPVSTYAKLITSFNIMDLLLFVTIHIAIFALAIAVLGKVYFKINSNVKVIKKTSRDNNYKIKTAKPIFALIKKDLNRFINSPVFVTNAGFGLVLFLVACISLCIKSDSLLQMLGSKGVEATREQILAYIPVILFGLICFTSFMSSITSSMISIEGKNFYILKSLPIKPFSIILSKVFTAVIIMIPIILVGDLIVLIKFKFNILETIIVLISSIVLPLLSETIGIVVNLKYPKMDAENDTEVVKQSSSSTVAVFIGMILTGITIFALIKCLGLAIQPDLIIASGLILYTLIYMILLIFVNKKGREMINKINI